MHSGTVVGELRTPLPAGLSVDDWGDRLEPARDAAAALLAGLIEHAGHALPGSLALQRTAMHEAGTYVWDWDMVTDVLGDIDEGERMLGYPLNTLGNTQGDWDRVVHPDDKALIDKAFAAHVRGEEPMYRVVYRARAADGRWRWIEERGRIVEWDRRGKPRRMFGTQSDANKLRDARTGAARPPPRRRGRQQRQDDVSLAHQPRAAHAAERGAGLRAVAGHRPGARRAAAATPAAAHDPARPATTCSLMIGDLLEFVAMEAAHLPIQLQNVALAPLFESCAAWSRPQADSAGVRVTTENPDAGAALSHGIASVRADPTRLRQVLTNLLSNAVKYNRPGGRVTLRARAVDDEWHIEVEDTGHGISPSDRARLFQPFNRLGREASAISGAGLGLALSQSLAQLMGGRITAQACWACA